MDLGWSTSDVLTMEHQEMGDIFLPETWYEGPEPPQQYGNKFLIRPAHPQLGAEATLQMLPLLEQHSEGTKAPGDSFPGEC